MLDIAYFRSRYDVSFVGRSVHLVRFVLVFLGCERCVVLCIGLLWFLERISGSFMVQSGNSYILCRFIFTYSLLLFCECCWYKHFILSWYETLNYYGLVLLRTHYYFSWEFLKRTLYIFTVCGAEILWTVSFTYSLLLYFACSWYELIVLFRFEKLYWYYWCLCYGGVFYSYRILHEVDPFSVGRMKPISWGYKSQCYRYTHLF